MVKGNSEFKGTIKTEINYIKGDIGEIKDNIKGINTEVTGIHDRLLKLETRAATYGGIAGFLVEAIVDALGSLGLGGVSLYQLADVGVILAVGVGVFFLGKAAYEKITGK